MVDRSSVTPAFWPNERVDMTNFLPAYEIVTLSVWLVSVKIKLRAGVRVEDIVRWIVIKFYKRICS